MKRVFLLSLLIPVSFFSIHSQADVFGSTDKYVAGAVVGLASAGIAKCAYDCIKGPRAHISSPQFEGSFGFLLGGIAAATATASAVLLNPTAVSSATVAKDWTSITFGALLLATTIKRNQVIARPKKTALEQEIDANLCKEISIAGACAGIISLAANVSKFM